MDPKYVLTPTGVTRELEVAGTVNRDTREPVDFMKTLGSRVPFDTGLLPPGLRSYSQAGDHTQMVFELPPGINMLNWARSEWESRDGQFEMYQVAQPYRVIVASLLKGNLLGARMFYTLGPIASPDTPLYHQNVPNINCEGYNGTGVGWVCLYHNNDWSDKTLGEKAIGIIERCSGIEAYNDANMSETDGTRFYAKMNKPSYLSNPKEWEAKTEAEGAEWVLDPELWIPVTVASIDDQSRHYDGGMPLTLGMVMDGMANMYYDDPLQPKPDQAIRRSDLRVDPNQLFTQVINDAFVNSPGAEPVKAKPKVKFGTAKPGLKKEIVACPSCGMDTYSHKLVITGDGTMCMACAEGYLLCPGCNVMYHEDGMPYDEPSEMYWCEACYSNKTASDSDPFPATSELQKILTEAAAATKKDLFVCNGCASQKPNGEKTVVQIPKDKVKFATELWLCGPCCANKFICEDCWSVGDNSKSISTATWTLVCSNCAQMCGDCSKVYPKSTMDSGKCVNCISSQPF